ncbi:MAG: tRNA (N6-isopentenyl adenosine(37)-C2)-methylthiotransferase MiaB [Bacteroidales bacterium]|nr:tRNA (N6-isopentenyl adenosine(37)-C2)-methylthiotransferase MiaB [Bacteroidales bacterium]
MKFYIETYGCQMNVADSEVVTAILQKHGYILVNNIDEAEIILVNTCSIRENAETRVRGRIKVFQQIKKQKQQIKIGVLGCMAERLKDQLLEQEVAVDLVVGPDSYKKLPYIIDNVVSGSKKVETELSKEETYEDILPYRYETNGISAFVSITRGCQNYCSYCIVPYVRGVERSRSPESIINEIRELKNNQYKEVTLIGQNVDSYLYKDISFSQLLKIVAQEFPNIRIRFSTNHPKDMSNSLLEVMATYPNICKHVHLPVQSGSNKMLQLMNRGYTREQYLKLIENIRKNIPDVAISTDIMVGFCDENEDDHRQTLSLMKEVGYDFAFMFKYSERSGTYAAKYLKDNVPEKEKIRRLNEVIALQNELSYKSKQQDVGKTFEVLVEGYSKKSKKQLMGRNSQNKVIVFDVMDNVIFGDFVKVNVESFTSATLIGKMIKS